VEQKASRRLGERAPKIRIVALLLRNRTLIKRPITIGGKKQRMHILQKSMLAAVLSSVAMHGSPYGQMRLPAGALLSARRD
jgi:arsenate reductase-like glutaredoxin family protein